MIRITQVKLPISHTKEDLVKKAAKLLKIKGEDIKELTVAKQSVDARKGREITYSYVLDVAAQQEEKLVRRAKNPNISIKKEKSYAFPPLGEECLESAPVIIGTGPAGLFCGLMLARYGYRPILLERGKPVEERTRLVEEFWQGGELLPNCNVQFGEGGAGTFSDGKLNTLVKDVSGRNGKVLKILSEFGADPAIQYQNKPHIGTDVLSQVVKNIRQEIIRLGGQVHFDSLVSGFSYETDSQGGRRIKGVIVKDLTDGSEKMIPARAVALAVGHSARDTFYSLWNDKIPMEAKAFAVGLRVQHPQKMIDQSQYGEEAAALLGPASYKLTCQTKEGRGVYSFCMCPGGYVVNASSEPGRLAVNGMSNHARDGKNANSAIIVTVTPEDFKGMGPLAGVEYQRELEEKAYALGGGKIPIQLYGDFQKNQDSQSFGDVEPELKGSYAFANLRNLLPEELSQALIEGMEAFGKRIQGFDRPDGILAGIESRTSSPVRIPRDQDMESTVRGLYPCGEGAGYAGGITSAAMDGIRVAEAIAKRYRPLAEDYRTGKDSGEGEN